MHPHNGTITAASSGCRTESPSSGTSNGRLRDMHLLSPGTGPHRGSAPGRRTKKPEMGAGKRAEGKRAWAPGWVSLGAGVWPLLGVTRGRDGAFVREPGGAAAGGGAAAEGGAAAGQQRGSSGAAAGQQRGSSGAAAGQQRGSRAGAGPRRGRPAGRSTRPAGPFCASPVGFRVLAALPVGSGAPPRSKV